MKIHPGVRQVLAALTVILLLALAFQGITGGAQQDAGAFHLGPEPGRRCGIADPDGLFDRPRRPAECEEGAVKRMKQAVEDLGVRTRGGGARFHGRNDAVAIIGNGGDDHSPDRSGDSGEVGDQHLHRDLAAFPTGRENQEREWDDA